MRNSSVSRKRISRTKAVTIAGALAVTGTIAVTSIGVSSLTAPDKKAVTADTAAVSALKAKQDQAPSADQKAPGDAAAQKLVADRAAAAAVANRDTQRAALDKVVADKVAADKAAADKAAADAAAKSTADKAAADAAAKAAADKAAADQAAAAKAASDAAAKAAASKAAADQAAAAKAAAAKAAATPAYANNLDGWIKQARDILNASGYPVAYNSIYQAAMHESAGNPTVVNGWDSNAAKGTPSIGLLQVIGPTFNSYKMSGHGNIYNPVDNIIAGVRYAADRYGSLDNVVANRCGGSCWVGY
jgi:hypothetical protein